MKLFTTLAASAVAQLNIGSLDDLFNQLNAGLPAADVADEGPVEGIGERYFAPAGTPPPATTPPPITPAPTDNEVYGTGCWKCDAMSYATCASAGYWQDCSNDQVAGDSGVCFIELRETSQALTQLCTGCKDAQACDDLKAQNFVYGAGSRVDARNQCKSNWQMQRPSRRRYGVMQSTCRQCFSMCTENGATDPKDVNGNYCFGGLTNEDANADVDLAAWFTVPAGVVDAGVATSTGSNTLTTEALGIPLHAVVGSAEAAKITSEDNHVMWGRDFAGAGSNTGKVAFGVGTGVDVAPGDTHEGYLFWSLHDHDMAFWSMDIVERQRINRFWMETHFTDFTTAPTNAILKASTDGLAAELAAADLDSL